MQRAALTLLPIAGLLLCILLFAACQAEPPAQEPAAPPVREVATYSVEQFIDSTSYRGASFSADGSQILVTSDQTGIPNIYTIPVAGGAPQALTESTGEPLRAVGYFPTDERLLYLSDEGGNERDHLYVRELDGTVQDLTPGENLKALFAGWARDDKTFFVATNERDQRYFDIYEYQVDGYEREQIYQDEVGYFFADITPDRRHIAFSKTVTNAESDIYLYDRETKEMKHITPHEGAVNHFAVAFTPDGAALDFVTDADSEFLYLMRHDLASGEREVVEKADWDLLFGGYSKQGTYRVVGINRDGRTEVRLYNHTSGERVPLPELPDAEISSLTFSPDESTIAFYASGARLPRDLFVYELGGGGAPRQLTRSLSAEIDPEDLVDGEVVRFDSFDGVTIPGILYKPHGASADNKVPALVWVHGGPGGQSRVGYRDIIQYLVNQGYAFYAINNRGSSGYGKTFSHMDDQQHGKGDLDDCVASKQLLIDTGYVDPERIGIIGGSYGGYMVLAALAFRPDAFAVGVDVFGISNWERTLQNMPVWWEAQRAALEKEMGAFDDTEYLRSISPLFHAENMVRPLFVLQGANDPRVLQAESDDIVEAVRANGVPVEYLVFEDEGHGFRKKENKIRGYQAIATFLHTYLRDAETTG